MHPKLMGNPVVAWRDETTVQIGWGTHSVVVPSAPAGLPQWLAMINGGRPREALLAAAPGNGIAEAQAGRLLSELSAAGLLEPPDPLQVTVHDAGLIHEPLVDAMRAVGLKVVDGADIVVFPQGQVPCLLGATTRARRLVPVWFVARAVHVGPVLDGACGPCPRCVDRTWADLDGRWPAIAAQSASTAAWQEPTQLYLAAGAIAHIADGASTVGLEMIFDPDRPGPRWRIWRAHPACECQRPSVPDTANGGP